MAPRKRNLESSWSDSQSSNHYLNGYSTFSAMMRDGGLEKIEQEWPDIFEKAAPTYQLGFLDAWGDWELSPQEFMGLPIVNDPNIPPGTVMLFNAGTSPEGYLITEHRMKHLDGQWRKVSNMHDVDNYLMAMQGGFCPVDHSRKCSPMCSGCM